MYAKASGTLRHTGSFARMSRYQKSRAGLTDRGKSNFGEVVQGMTGLRLQPLFVEWMMGFPEGWTDAS
jgi:hypothetical protein